jgi:hypothetical protein
MADGYADFCCLKYGRFGGGAGVENALVETTARADELAAAGHSR